jgi:hypothetical protein
VVPLDPGRHWLAAGITGLARQREWDVVATVDGPGTVGDEAVFVALPDGRLVVEEGPPGFSPVLLAKALADSIEMPYRALAVRRPELWVVGASALEVIELGLDLRGHVVEVVRDDSGVSVRVDGMPSLHPVPELERRGESRSPTYVARASRLGGTLFEVEVEPL